MADEWKYSTMEEVNNFKDWEFVLIDSEHQKKLNQWRHQYLLRIISTCQLNDSIRILIARKEIK
jgi:hypothetical protein